MSRVDVIAWAEFKLPSRSFFFTCISPTAAARLLTISIIVSPLTFTFDEPPTFLLPLIGFS
jgi:hypothetical protein